MNYFRVQHKGISLEEMKQHRAFIDVDPVTGDELYENGVCACRSANGYDGDQKFGGAWQAMDDDDEVIIFTGSEVAGIYDGVVVMPDREIARFTIAEWQKMEDDETAFDYEDWS